MKHTLAIDLGGTNTRFAIFTKDLTLQDEMSIATNPQWGAKIASEKWLDAIAPWLTKYSIDLVGIGSPGPLDTKRGMILETPNLKNWALFSFTDFFKTKLNLDCVLENDANCAVFGEWTYLKIPNLIALTLGTGVGSGIISEGKLILGAGGLASEAGHMSIDRNGPLCECGKRGCLEVFVGGASLVKRYNERQSQPVIGITPQEIFNRAGAGESLAQEFVKEWVWALAIGVGNLVNIFNPQKIILTGGVSHAFNANADEFHKILLTEAFKESLKWCDVAVSQLQDKAGIIGVAAWAQTRKAT
ncbi:MAG: ROK family protein [Oligoflexia bacterium]|nr:ROK family protein [Oligoflexia bacterium]